MTSWIREFSLPHAAADESVFETIVTTHGAAIASWLLDQHGEEIDRATDGLVDFVRDWASKPQASLAAWDVSFGRAHLTLKDGKLDPVAAAVRIGLRIALHGHPGKWRTWIPATLVHIDNRIVTKVEYIEVDSTSEKSAQIMLRTKPGDEVRIYRDLDNKKWTSEPENTHGLLSTVGKNRAIYLLTKSALPHEEQGGEIFNDCQPAIAVTSEMLQSIDDGFAILEKNVPQYIPWIERVLRGIVVCPKQEEYRLVSGSWEDAPGFVHMTSPHIGLDIAEILVHECAHQYFYMLQRVGALDDSSDSELYWSPPIRKKRPLSRILMAYHALVNVQLLYESIRLNDANDPRDINYVRANEPNLRAAIETLDEPLRNNPALTQFGQGLYDPLAKRSAAVSNA